VSAATGGVGGLIIAGAVMLLGGPTNHAATHAI
jgi:hypothetical protein